MNTKLIDELREWAEVYSESGDFEPQMFNEFNKILSRHDEPKEEGSVEGLCGTCNGSGMVSIGPNIRGVKTCQTCNGKGKITGTRATPANEEPLEPKMGGMVCPKCSTIVKYPDEYQKKEESLAVLAEKHNWPFVYYRKRVNPDDGPYTIELSDGYHIGRGFHGPTYAAAEAKAREYLNGLEDKGGK